MSQRAQLMLTIIGGLLIGLIFLHFMNPGCWNQSGIKFGKMETDSSAIPLVLILLGLRLCQLLVFIGYLLFIVRGFHVHWAWGLANIFLPFAWLFFLINHPRHGKMPALVLAAGPAFILLIFLLWFLFDEFA